ncbi:MAG: bifunctional oligoribonuclease/PAP phosphatase NrnA [Bacilli bacterium]|nr:bifunctional oligoribonuclease/PAP phosphatase NrnA [Bacilli bacterium]
MKNSNFKVLSEKLTLFDKIAIFRHIHPDFDAIGASFALKKAILLNFKKKDVKIFGDNNDNFIKNNICPKSDKVSENWFSKPFLAIILDTANKSRVSNPNWTKNDYSIKIDHHPFIEKFCKKEYIDSNASSTSEILFYIFKKIKFKIDESVASFLYMGIVGDTGRFRYNLSSKTFSTVESLQKNIVDLSVLYNRMYSRDLNDIQIITFILSNYIVYKNKIIYYILYDKNLKQLNMDVNKGKEFVNIFQSIKNICIWCSITEDVSEKCFRVSIRSSKAKINDVATKWNGGGHAKAAGAKIFDIKKELKTFLNDLYDTID